jgi:uroporphyrinogen-III decarboxylase
LTGKELVRRTVNFDNPPRIARSSPQRDGDTFRVGVGPAADFRPARPGQDQWGCVKEKRLDSVAVGYPTQHPLADWEQYRSYRFPDPRAAGRFDRIEQLVREGDSRLAEKYVYAVVGPGPITLVSFLLGFENFLMTLALHPERVAELVRRHGEYMLGVAEGLVRYDQIDALIVYDDSAMQTGPFFSMEMWRELFRPQLAEFCAFTHSHGRKAMMHCCGNLKDHLAEFCECGVDILDNKQPLLWLERAEEFKGRMTFHSCVDYPVFERMPAGSVRPQTERLVRSMSTPAGGFIGTVSNMIDPAVPPEKVDALWDSYHSFRW